MVLFAVVAMCASVAISQPQTSPSAPPANPSPSQTINSSCASKDKEIEELKKENSELKAQMKPAWVTLLEHGWPLLVLFSVVWFSRPLWRLISGLAASVDRATIEIGGVKYSAPNLNKLIVEREILKISIKIAGADGQYEDKEKERINFLISSMTDWLNNLGKDDKDRVLKEAIEMAATDGEIQDDECGMIIELADQFGRSRYDIEEMVVKHCASVKPVIKVPSHLQKRVARKHVELYG
jgi:hypothetical protein